MCAGCGPSSSWAANAGTSKVNAATAASGAARRQRMRENGDSFIDILSSGWRLTAELAKRPHRRSARGKAYPRTKTDKIAVLGSLTRQIGGSYNPRILRDRIERLLAKKSPSARSPPRGHGVRWRT
jgi:hypothetical protein